MFCTNCGAQVQDGASFCPNCGQRLSVPQPVPQPQPTWSQPQQSYQQPEQTYQQTQQSQSSYQQSCSSQQAYAQQAVQQPEQGMKWHKFIVYFAIWASAFISFVNGIRCLTGGHYGEYKEMVYAFIPGLKAPDILYGLLALGAVAIAIVTGLSLLKFRANGPKLLTILYIYSAGSSLLYLVWAGAVLSSKGADVSSVIGSVIGSLVGSVVMIFVNKAYYAKRAHLFVN